MRKHVFSSVPRSVWTMASPPPAHISSHMHVTKHGSRTCLHFEHERGPASEWAEVAWSLTYGFVRKDLKSKDDFALNYTLCLLFQSSKKSSAEVRCPPVSRFAQRRPTADCMTFGAIYNPAPLAQSRGRTCETVPIGIQFLARRHPRRRVRARRVCRSLRSLRP